MFGFFKKKKTYGNEIAPDEIFLDSHNSPGFNKQQFEGLIEQPIKKNTLLLLGGICLMLILGILVRTFFLQVARGADFFELSENNRLHRVPIFAERGVIYDRNGTELAWNIVPDADEPFLYREYITDPGFAHVLGYVNYPERDDDGFFWRLDIEGKEGVEKIYNQQLQGNNGYELIETNAQLQPQSRSQIAPPQNGDNLTLTIDAEVQSQLFTAITDMVDQFDYEAGAGVIMDVTNGELLAMVSAPEYDPRVIADGSDVDTIQRYFSDATKPFLNRIVSGLYTPGSIVKPFLAIGALHEGLIIDQTQIYSSGRIEIPNRFDPDNPSVFRDWRRKGHGMTDVYHAIADSVNTFFYAIGGGYADQQGLGIDRINTYIEAFGITKPTNLKWYNEVSGLIPNPTWKAQVFDGDRWFLGDTYNTSIGQFGFQVSPIQMVRAIGGIASYGNLHVPHVLQSESPDTIRVSIDMSTADYRIVQDAMRQTVTDGTAQILDVPYVNMAAKTGTAQVGRNNEFVNSWSTGFWPADNPRYAFVVVMEKGPTEDTVGATWAVGQLINWMNENGKDGYFVNE